MKNGLKSPVSTSDQSTLFTTCQVLYSHKTGEYSIFAFYTVTKIKILGIFKHRQGEKYDDIKVKYFFDKAYKLYKK
jgi:hypothetical protein